MLVTVANGPSSGVDIDQWSRSLAAYWPTNARAVDLFYLYLVRSLGNRHGPVVSVAGGEQMNLDRMLRAHCGRGVDSSVIEKVAERAGGSEMLERVAKKLSVALNGQSIYTTEYGSALALIVEEQAR